MAELNWVDKNERLPTESDANEDGYVYAIANLGVVSTWHLSHFKSPVSQPTHWLPFHEMPVPKRWRVPTIMDLAKAGKPIPCRVRSSVNDVWQYEKLCMLSVKGDDEYPYWCADDSGYKFCEICDE